MVIYNTVTLGDIANINVNTYSVKENWDFINYLDTSNITRNEIDNIQYIPKRECVPSRARRKVSYNSIIYSTVRPNQQHYGIIKSVPDNFLVSTGFAVIDVIPEKADPDYIYFVLSKREIVEYLQSIAEQSTSAYPAIKPTDLELIEIHLPDINIQRKISSILCSINLKIDVNRRINDNLEQQLHSIYSNIFAEYNADTELGQVIETTSGSTPSRKHNEFYENGDIYWVKSKELFGKYIIDTEEKINNIAINNTAVKLLPKHSVLIAMYGATVGAHGIISVPMSCNQAICALISNKDYPYTYLYQLVKESQQKLVNMAVGSAQQNISQVLIRQLPVHGCIDKISEFHLVAQPLHEMLKHFQIENNNLSQLRDTLLPQLLSGEIDVSNLDI